MEAELRFNLYEINWIFDLNTSVYDLYESIDRFYSFSAGKDLIFFLDGNPIDEKICIQHISDFDEITVIERKDYHEGKKGEIVIRLVK